MISPKEALAKLIEGNNRFLNAPATKNNEELRLKFLDFQKPYAVVISCSDSRVAPEIIFDSQLGDIFTVRSAGNILSKEAIGGIEYAIEHLGVSLIMVLGHDDCGAVRAVLEHQDGSPVSDNFQAVIDRIEPAIKEVKKQNLDQAEALNQAIERNALRTVEDLKACEPVIADQVRKGKLDVVAANYSLKTGQIKVFENCNL